MRVIGRLLFAWLSLPVGLLIGALLFKTCEAAELYARELNYPRAARVQPNVKSHDYQSLSQKQISMPVWREAALPPGLYDLTATIVAARDNPHQRRPGYTDIPPLSSMYIVFVREGAPVRLSLATMRPKALRAWRDWAINGGPRPPGIKTTCEHLREALPNGYTLVTCPIGYNLGHQQHYQPLSQHVIHWVTEPGRFVVYVSAMASGHWPSKTLGKVRYGRAEMRVMRVPEASDVADILISRLFSGTVTGESTEVSAARVRAADALRELADLIE